MRWNAEYGAECVFSKTFPMHGNWLNEFSPCIAVDTELAGGCVKIALQNYGGAVVERVGQWRFAVDPVQAVVG